MHKKTVKDINLKNKRVLLRADYNVPVNGGKISDDYRIKQSIQTIDYILNQKGSSLVIVSHLGRPKAPGDRTASLAPVAKHLSRLLNKQVYFAPDCVGEPAKSAADKLKPGDILVLENTRYHKEEEENSKAFAKQIVDAVDAKVFVQDGFGVAHRAHATTEAITHLLPSVAGLLLEKEVMTITKVMKDPDRPLVAVVGGAKISDKIDVLNRLIDLADCVAIGGAMTNTFLLAEGVKVGQSLVERKVVDVAEDILYKVKQTQKQRAFGFLMPVDAVVSTDKTGKKSTRIVDISSHSIADIEAYPKKPSVSSHSVEANESILDIGPISAGQIAGAVKMAKTVIWNGTLGITEVNGIAGAANPFSHGTKIVTDAMIGPTNWHHNKPFTLVGGGDTAGYVEQQGLVEDFNHVSTGGGATLDLMVGRKLPGIEALLDK